MKTSVLIPLLCLAAVAGPGWAAGEHSHHAVAGAQASAEPQWVAGQIRKVDKAAGKVTLAHGPLPHLGMPAMTMVFRVKDVAWLDRMRDGEKIRFIAEQPNGILTLTHYEAAN